MEKNYSIDIIDEVLTIRFRTAPKLDDLYGALDEVLARKPSKLRLWDLTKGGLTLTTQQLQGIAKYGKSLEFHPSKVAIVAPDMLSFGLARMFEVYREKESIEHGVFHTEEEALAWLRES